MGRKETQGRVEVDNDRRGPIDDFAEGKNDRFVLFGGDHRYAAVLETFEKAIRGETPAAGNETERGEAQESDVFVGVSRTVGVLNDDIALVVQMTEKGAMMLHVFVALAFEREENRPRRLGWIGSIGRVIRMKEWKCQMC